MSIKRERDWVTDQAWKNLHKRFEQDNLLPVEAVSRRTIMQPFAKKAICAAVLLCLMVSVFTWLYNKNTPETELLTLHNGKGEPTLITTFEDGSVVYMSQQTSLEYPTRFAEDKRKVFLQGNAFFEVNSNWERPFIIDTKSALIEVKGTAFNIQSPDEARFSLSVRHGEVKVTSKKDGKNVRVNAGETATLHSDVLQTLQISDFDFFDEYLTHVSFKDQSLSDIVRIINESTNSIQVKVSPELGDRLITGTFSNTSPETMVELICTVLNLQPIRQQNTIYIARSQ
jgi:ferric-dicitrate binding protein FerR (iron transport regulator)